MESEEISEVIRKRPQASVEVSSKVHGNPLNQSIIYKQRSGISLKDKNANPDCAAGGEARTSKSSGRAVVVINRVRAGTDDDDDDVPPLNRRPAAVFVS